MVEYFLREEEDAGLVFADRGRGRLLLEGGRFNLLLGALGGSTVTSPTPPTSPAGGGEE